ncbi:ABC transporter permease, partial [Streptomyces sp. NPDC004365]
MTAVCADVPLPARRGRGRRRPVLVLAGAAFLALVVLAAGFTPLLAPYAPDAVDLSASLVGTSGDHPLGTDASGQDLLSRVLYGARTSLIAPLALLAIAALLGVTLGTVAAWRGGWADTLVSRVTVVMY